MRRIGKRKWNDHTGQHCLCSRPAVAKRGGDWICAHCLNIEAKNGKNSLKTHGVCMVGATKKGGR